MLHSYDEIYTAKAQTSLAQMLRYAEEDMHIELNEFWDMFLISGVAPQVKPTFCLDKSPTYWTGWILAWYQWYSGQSFRRISEFLTPEQVRDMYSPYHEMDPVQFADAADAVRRRKEMSTRLRMYRERLGLSQSELARESGVSVRMIQHYEQRQKDLGKAQTNTIWMLARALHCSMEDLMEY